MRLVVVVFDVATKFAGIVLNLAPCCAERIADADINIAVVGMGFMVFVD